MCFYIAYLGVFGITLGFFISCMGNFAVECDCCVRFDLMVELVGGVVYKWLVFTVCAC